MYEVADKPLITEAIKAYNLDVTATELVEYTASYCLLEDFRFDVSSGAFSHSSLADDATSSQGIAAVLMKPENLEYLFQEVTIHRDTSRTGRRILLLSFKEVAALMEVVTNRNGCANLSFSSR